MSTFNSNLRKCTAQSVHLLKYFLGDVSRSNEHIIHRLFSFLLCLGLSINPQKRPVSRLNQRQVLAFTTRIARLCPVSDRTLFTNDSPTAVAIKSYLDCICVSKECAFGRTLCIRCIYLEHEFFLTCAHSLPCPINWSSKCGF